MSSEDIFPSVPAHWEKVTLGQLAKSSGGGIQTGPFGSQLHAHDYVADGIPSIMPKNITVDAILTDDIARVSAEDIERLSKYKVQVGDVIYSRRGDVEKCARITSKEDGWLCGTGCLRVRVLPGQVSTEYLHAYLCHPQVREWIVRHAVGATMPNLNTSILNALPIIIPSKSEMEFISSVWLNISEKIQLNQQINQTLEQMAQAIFKSWFVDFEPVKAKIEALEAGGSEDDALLAAMQAISGKDPQQLAQLQTENPEQYATLRATAELFPAAMQESELGEIPEGWDVCQIEEILDRLKPSKRYTKKQISLTGQVPVYEQGADILLGFHNDEPGFIATPDNPAFIFGDHTCVTRLSCQSFDISQNVIPLKGKSRPTMWVYYAVQGQQEFQEYRRHWSELIVKPVIYPTVDICERYSETITKFVCKKESLERENQSLAELRDTLLPKLLTGELSVNQDAE